MKLIETLKKNPLVGLAALVQAAAFALSGSVYFGPFGWLLGAVAGLVINLSMAYAASRIADIAKARRWVAWPAFVILFALSPLAIAPAEYHLLAQGGAVAPGWAAVVAVVWSILPDAAIIAAGGVAGKSLVQTQDEQPAKPKPQPAPQKKPGAGKCEFCGAQYNSKGAHMRQHHPDKVQHKVYAVAVEEIGKGPRNG